MKDYAKTGIEIGEHISDYENFTKYIEDHFDPDKLDFVLIMMKPVEMPRKLWREWGEFFKKHKITFAFLYTQQRGAPEGKDTHLTPEIVEELKQTAGEYFLGDMIGETGGLASWLEGYYDVLNMEKPDFQTLSQAKQAYIEHVRSCVDIDRKLDVPSVLAVEATVFSRYNFEAGVDHTVIEMMCGNPEIMFASARGACKAYNKKIWSSHIAHEWYGGFRNDDPLKYKRLKVAYYYAFLSGAKYIYPESGDISISSYGYHYDTNHPLCKTYRDIRNEFTDFARLHYRPQSGPEVKVAFLHGYLDGYTGWGGSTVWNNFGKEDWVYGSAEKGWSVVTDELFKGDPWYHPHNYGQNDTSFSVPYGQYDLVPVEAPLKVLSDYDYLIFVGWNTMTEELYDKLKACVEQGGKLLASIPHLSTNDVRNQEFSIIRNGDVSDLFGVVVKGPGRRHAWGVKFIEESTVDGCLYPCTKDEACDPMCADGLIRSADIEMKGGKVIAVLSDRFFNTFENRPPILTEYACGKGTATLLTAWDYPGAESLRRLFKTILKSILSGEQRKARVQVIGDDKIRYGVYRQDGFFAVYILNTDYNRPGKVSVCFNDMRLEIEVNSCDMRIAYLTDDFICSPCDNRIALEDIRTDNNRYHLNFNASGSHELEWMQKSSASSVTVNGIQALSDDSFGYAKTNHSFPDLKNQ